MAKTLDDVLSQMRERGLEPPLRLDLNKAFASYVRWRPAGQKGTKKSAWMRLHTWKSPRTGVEYISGAYGVRNEVYAVEASTSDWSPAERAAEQEARQAAAKAAEAERAKDADEAATKAARMWERGRPAEESGQHPYLARKQVSAFGLRILYGKTLLIPLVDLQGKLHGLQYIDADGEKRYGTATAIDQHYHLIGEIQPDQPIAFGEGYATCASAHMATGWPVVTCFDARNLELVIGAWRKIYPDHAFVTLADDDRFLLERLAERLFKVGITVQTSELKIPLDASWDLPSGSTVQCKVAWKPDPNGGPMRLAGSITVGGRPQMVTLENAGMAKAALAHKRHSAKPLVPPFPKEATTGTDWNDYHVEHGLPATRQALLDAIQAQEPDKKHTKAAEKAAKAAEEREQALDRASTKGMSLFERFTLIYGTTTAWDEVHREIYRLEALKVAYGRAIDIWLDSPKRNMVPQSHVVFDPTGQSRLPDFVNLFDRLPLDPDPMASCDLILKHIFILCGEDDRLYHWLLCWLAFPLQHPGAKMRTSVILYGRTEGTGKSMLTDVMRDIYGRYARTITQRQLESEFNGWQSAMLFCVAEEVVSRQDRAHLQGLIQNLITNKVVQINEKNLPLRQEANLTNFVFHSNNQVPMLLNDTDRRFTVIKAETEHPPEYFIKLGREADNGGAAAFYHYLLKYELGDFNEHTRPFHNKDRMALITLGMQPDRRFFEFWRRGLAGVPFCTCTARDLYMAFKAWCKANGERFVANSTAFGKTITDCLTKLQVATPKKAVRWEGYAERQIEAGIGNDDMPSAQQSVVYFVPARLRRLKPAGTEDDPGDVSDTPAESPGDAEDENPLEAQVYNRWIKEFQKGMYVLLSSARRAL